MPRLHTAHCIAAVSLFFLTAAIAADRPNLTGTWKMNPAKSDLGSNAIKRRVDTIEHQEPQLKFTTTQDDENGKNTVVRDYVTDGREMTKSISSRHPQTCESISLLCAKLTNFIRSRKRSNPEKISTRLAYMAVSTFRGFSSPVRQYSKAERYRTKVALRDPATNQIVWRSGKLKATRGENKAVSVGLPAGLLKRQNYNLELTGMAPGGVAELVSSYPFGVATR